MSSTRLLSPWGCDSQKQRLCKRFTNTARRSAYALGLNDTDAVQVVFGLKRKGSQAEGSGFGIVIFDMLMPEQHGVWHPLREIQETLRHLKNGGIRVHGALLNGLQPKGSRYGYHYGNYYQYGYE
ncbi:MAG: hypothetical protein Q9M29_03720 [Mariprofundaceae bacterium]|nr:hypothetical protein [Mariprofundaceae bacterium]